MALAIDEIEPGTAATADLYALLQTSMKGEARIIRPDPDPYSSTETVRIRILVERMNSAKRQRS
jgi:hypothetical protein